MRLGKQQPQYYSQQAPDPKGHIKVKKCAESCTTL